MTHATIMLRKATPRDAADMAILDDMAADGLSAWFWQGAVKQGKAEHAYAFGRRRMLDGEALYSWANCVIAECEGLVAGMLTGYPMPPPRESEKWQEPVLKPIFELMAAAVGDWFVDALAVYPEQRGKGVASMLLGNALARGAGAGAAAISLIAASDNRPALTLYEKHGFTERDRRTYVGTDGREAAEKYHLLMTRSV